MEIETYEIIEAQLQRALFDAGKALEIVRMMKAQEAAKFGGKPVTATVIQMPMTRFIDD